MADNDKETTPAPRPRFATSGKNPGVSAKRWTTIAIIGTILGALVFAVIGNYRPEQAVQTPAVTANDPNATLLAAVKDLATQVAELKVQQAPPAVIPPDALQVPPLSEVRVPPAPLPAQQPGDATPVNVPPAMAKACQAIKPGVAYPYHDGYYLQCCDGSTGEVLQPNGKPGVGLCAKKVATK